MRKRFLLVFTLLISALFSLTRTELEFVHQHELWNILERNLPQISQQLHNAPDDTYLYTILLDYYRAIDDSVHYALTLFDRARNLHDLESAYSYVSLEKRDPNHETQSTFLRDIEFTLPDEQQVIQLAIDAIENDSLRQNRIDNLLGRYGEANVILESFAKQKVDDIAVERNDSLRIVQIDALLKMLPESQWTPSLHYLRVNSFLNQKKFDAALEALVRIPARDDIERYAIVRAMLNSDLLDELQQRNELRDFLENAEFIINQMGESDAKPEKVRFMYDRYSPDEFDKKIGLLRTQLTYYKLKYDLIGSDEREETIREASEILSEIHYDINDTGQLAEIAFWNGRIFSMSREVGSEYTAAKSLIECLVLGAPRKRYDEKAYELLEGILIDHEIFTPTMQWVREIVGYYDIQFDDITIEAGLGDCHESRVAFGDFDNDGDDDLLLSGRKIWRNNGDATFTDITEKASFKPKGATGGLWADYNRDGYLDIVVTSNSSDALYPAMGVGFYPKADTTISDPYPTEGAAWTDLNWDGYPELYMASYEVAGEYIGLPDYFYDNLNGEMIDMTDILGFRTQYNDSLDAQAGRGIAPADYDNDGEQEILVCNYRLDRNFLFNYDPKTGKVTDIAALEGLAGHNVGGWYGHTIGADWGDYDNDGDLDLFMCNLAHPRYIEFSDVSMLLRNDGQTYRIIDGEEVTYTQFTDVTREAGITYDELHSDPSWFDADNDGDLDLFMTSIYQNDRSYLYRNNGDGTFTDITWLSGCRSYNGWGNAIADIDLDGKLDICVGSGSGFKLFLNTTKNSNRSALIKPFWNMENLSMVARDGWRRYMPNTPGWGTRVELVYYDKSYPAGRRKLIRELSSAKGTTSQNSQYLHFGFGNGDLLEINLYQGNKRINQINMKNE